MTHFCLNIIGFSIEEMENLVDRDNYGNSNRPSYVVD